MTRRWLGTVFCTAMVAAMAAGQPHHDASVRALAATCDAPSEEGTHRSDPSAGDPIIVAGSLALAPPSRCTIESSFTPPAAPARLAALIVAPKTSPPSRC